MHPKGDQYWVFIGRTNAEAETPILWPPDVKRRLIGKDPDAGRDRRQEEKGTTEDEMVGWHHRLNGHQFEKALGDGRGQGRLVCCSLWGHKELDTTEQLNDNDLMKEGGAPALVDCQLESKCTAVSLAPSSPGKGPGKPR